MKSLNTYLTETFGKKVYKVSIDAGFTCPNRENGGRGCIFCSAGGSGEFAGNRIATRDYRGDVKPGENIDTCNDVRGHDEEIINTSNTCNNDVYGRDGEIITTSNTCKDVRSHYGKKTTFNNYILNNNHDNEEIRHDAGNRRNISITRQIEIGEEFILRKLPKDKPYGLVAYFQAYTNTYDKVSVLREKYMEAINHPRVVAISIATRPDCLPDDVVDLIAELDKIKPVWVELGLQTIHDKSAAYIRRGYPLSVYDDAVMRLTARGINTITHVILGLPHETREMMLETVKYVGKSGSNGIKLQLLHVLRGTDLADEYAAGVFEVMTEDEYVDLIADAVALLPGDMVVHRMTGDGDKRLLIAPLWSANKKHVLNAITRRLNNA